MQYIIYPDNELIQCQPANLVKTLIELGYLPLDQYNINRLDRDPHLFIISSDGEIEVKLIELGNAHKPLVFTQYHYFMLTLLLLCVSMTLTTAHGGHL